MVAPRKRLPLLGAFVFTWLGGVATGQVVRSFEVIAAHNDPSPSIAATATYGLMSGPPAISQGGHVTFNGAVGGVPVSRNYAIWTGLPGEVQALVVKGDPVPGRTGETFDVFAFSAAADYLACTDGSVAFRAKTFESGDEGVWLGKPGELHEVLLENNPAPGIPGSTVKGTPGAYVANGDGLVLIQGEIEGGGAAAGGENVLWAGEPDALQVTAREGSQAAGFPGGVNYRDFEWLSMNTHGVLCIDAIVAAVRDRVLYTGLAGAITPRIREGDPISILPGSEWIAFDKARINEPGDIAFEAFPFPPGQKTFWVYDHAGATTRIAIEGTPAPGPGTAWEQFFFNRPLVAGAYRAFRAGYGGGPALGRGGIWLAEGSGIELVAKSGDPAPGLLGQSFDTFEEPCVNARGMVVFKALTDSRRHGLWFYHEGTLELLVADTDFLDVGDGGAAREITTLHIKSGSGNQSGYASGLNDAGKLVFRGGMVGLPVSGIFQIDLCGLVSCPEEDLIEEAFGGDPNSPADDFAILPSVHRDGGDMVLSFRRRTDGSFAYSVEEAATLNGWGVAPGAVTPAADQGGLPAGFERVEYRKAIVPSGAAQLRVRVTRN